MRSQSTSELCANLHDFLGELENSGLSVSDTGLIEAEEPVVSLLRNAPKLSGESASKIPFESIEFIGHVREAEPELVDGSDIIITI